METVIGHTQAKKIFKKNVSTSCWIIHGMAGIGKFKLANAFANMLINQKQKTTTASLRIITSQKQISIEDIRDAQNFLLLTNAGKKVVIIDSSETMTESASNCLLKIIEEPPPNSYIILITCNISLLPRTLIFRCFSVYLNPLSLNETASVLQKNNISCQNIIDLFGSPGILSNPEISNFYTLLKSRSIKINELISFLLESTLTYDHVLYAINRIIINNLNIQNAQYLSENFTKIQKLISDAKKLHANKNHVFITLAHIIFSIKQYLSCLP